MDGAFGVFALLASVVFSVSVWRIIVKQLVKRGWKLITRHLVAAITILFVGLVPFAFMTGGWFSITVGIIITLVALSFAVDVPPSGKKQQAIKVTETPSSNMPPEVAKELVIIAELILADGKVDQREAEQLLKMLQCIPMINMGPITRTLYQSVEFALSDGELDDTEAEEIKVLLGEICDLNTVDIVQATPKPIQQSKAKTKPSKQPAKPVAKSKFSPVKVASKVSAGDCLDMTYEDAEGNLSQRRVDLKQITENNGRTYLVGWCHKVRAVRTFRCDRILMLVDTSTGEVIEHEYGLKVAAY